MCVIPEPAAAFSTDGELEGTATMKYNPLLHRRRSIRLKGYNYAQAGLYFITICTQNRVALFGAIVAGEMVLNDAGRMVEKWYYELENKFRDIKCREMIVMPNHFHCVVQNVGGMGVGVGADLCVCPITPITPINPINPINPCPPAGPVGPPAPVYPDFDNVGPADVEPADGVPAVGGPILGEHIGSPLRAVVQWFKTMTTNEYIRGVKTFGWQPFQGKLWQRNYWEHIIRNEADYERIAQYIIGNPKKW